jgi:hypothetical protein
MARANTLRGQSPTAQHTTALKNAANALYQDLARFTDDYAVSDLRAADVRAGHWLDDDPSLEAIRRWVGGR